MEETIRSFLQSRRWIDPPYRVGFLARGEYNENYWIDCPTGSYVFRINHGSQLDLPNQIEYEYRVLESVQESGLTPVPVAYELAPPELAGGALLMSFLPGEHLSYQRDAPRAAETFARIHGLPADSRLVKQPSPVRDILAECDWLVARYPDHPRLVEKARILRYRDHVARLADETEDLFANETPCIVNTEVNSNNFLVSEEAVRLVDWEKAVVSPRYQDLGHFLVETTTRWKTDFVFTDEARLGFLEAYRAHMDHPIPLEELSEKTRVLENTILLRALSWCYMAYYEYTETDRPIQNQDTFSKISQYLDESEWLLEIP